MFANRLSQLIRPKRLRLRFLLRAAAGKFLAGCILDHGPHSLGMQTCSQSAIEISDALAFSSGGAFNLEMLQQLPYLGHCIKVKC